LTGKYIVDGRTWDFDIEGLWLWLAVAGLERYRLNLDWWPFMSALVLFQPPLDTLQEFAEYAGIVRKDPFAKYRKAWRKNPEFRRKERATSYDPMLVGSLISTLPNPYALERVWQDYYETLIDEINQRFLKPRGLDIHEMRNEILADGTLDESLQERLKQIPQDLYVKIPKHAKRDELREAVRLAASMLEEEPEKVDEQAVETSQTDLMKVEIAYRHYCLRQDFRDIENRYPNITSDTLKK